MARARIWRKRFGGGMRQVGILAAAGLHALDHHVDRLADDHARAARFAAAVGAVAPSVVGPERVETNIVMLDLSESPENQVRSKAPVDVNRTYVGMLRREPEPDGFNYWVEKVRGGVSVGDLVRLFFESSEYKKRFG
jgi:threonine aldolase